MDTPSTSGYDDNGAQELTEATKEFTQRRKKWVQQWLLAPIGTQLPIAQLPPHFISAED